MVCRIPISGIFRLALFLGGMGFAFGVAGVPGEDDLPPVDLIEARDFSALAGSGEISHKPLLLVFVADYCHFCKAIEEEYLKPMLRNRDYDNKVVIRLFRVDMPGQVIDFYGKPVSEDEFAARYDAKLTPTAVFLDSRGRELAPRIVGVSNIEFYGGFLDDGIEQARAALTRNVSRDRENP